ncbi:hypothetical protein CIK05_06665 [Bdellovibrio sp. qaytius]|nr:hypothetical protein CIK05_06665 [Bdellovibrio sp. qaytius]
MNCTADTAGNPGFSSSNFVSGNGANQNNPNATNVRNSGPIPAGSFNVGGQASNSSRRNLTPQTGTDLGGRNSFQIHGCSNPATCSDGCIAATTNATRDELNRIFGLEEGHNTITVVP